jgi:hypothetical protein
MNPKGRASTALKPAGTLKYSGCEREARSGHERFEPVHPVA